MKSISTTLLSKVVSHALRHEPWLYELELDDEGWTSVADLLTALRQQGPEWGDLVRADLERMIAGAQKRRHEVSGERIRALYGHSLSVQLQRRRATPPSILFHGTAPGVAEIILRDGLRPMGRQYVHLSVDNQGALEVGRRKASHPVLLRVRALAAHQRGEVFYVGNEKVWLADFISSEFIERSDDTRL